MDPDLAGLAKGLMPLVCAGAGLAVASALMRRRPGPAGRTLLRDWLPFTGIEDDGRTVRLQRGGRFQVVELGGVRYVGRGASAVEVLVGGRYDWLRSLQRYGVTVRSLSRQKKVRSRARTQGGDFLGDLGRAWAAYLDGSFLQEHHLLLSVSSRNGLRELDAAVESTLSQLESYSPRVIERGETTSSDLVNFLYELVSGFPGHHGSDAPFPDVLAGISIEHRPDGVMIVRDGEQERWSTILGVQVWPDWSASSLITDILRQRSDVAVCLRSEAIPQGKAVTRTLYRTRQASIFRLNALVAEEWAATNDELGANATALLRSELFLHVTGSSEDEMREGVRGVRDALGRRRMLVVPEGEMGERAAWSRLPGYDYWTRPFELRAQNVAELLPWETEPKGHGKSDFGNAPARVIPTALGRTPYSFIFQVRPDEQAPPHWALFGGTGGGKTMAAGLLLTGALAAYENIRIFAFDRDAGLAVLTAAVGGSYLMPATGGLPLNPFDVENDAEHRAALERFLAMLAEVDDDKSLVQIRDAVLDIMGSTPGPGRRLSVVLDSAFPAGSPVRSGLQKWARGERYGSIFNAERDAFDPTAGRWMGIGMDGVGEDQRLASALTFYLFERIQTAVAAKGVPHVIFVDESATLLKEPSFAREVERLLRTARKNRGSVGLAFQEVDGLPDAMQPTIQANVSTFLFMPGSARLPESCQPYGLTDDEVDFVLGRWRPSSDLARNPVLLKRADESVILDFDMRPLGRLMQPFQGGAQPVARMRRLIEKEGEDGWLKAFVDS